MGPGAALPTAIVLPRGPRPGLRAQAERTAGESLGWRAALASYGVLCRGRGAGPECPHHSSHTQSQALPPSPSESTPPALPPGKVCSGSALDQGARDRADAPGLKSSSLRSFRGSPVGPGHGSGEKRRKLGLVLLRWQEGREGPCSWPPHAYSLVLVWEFRKGQASGLTSSPPTSLPSGT